jgi:translocation and assembly module TamA
MILRALLLLALVALAACVPARRKVEGTIVRDLSFAGNGGALSGHNDYQLRLQMVQKEARYGVLVWPLLYTVTPRPLREEVLLRDAYRLEVWYAHHGWFDARVEGFELRQVRRETERRAGVVDIRGHVEPGAQSTVRSLRVEGVARFAAIQNAALRTAPIREGDPFDLDTLEATRDLLLSMLRDAAHPYATVEMTIEAHPEARAVDVVYAVEEGINADFGPVSLAGSEDVPERFIEGKAAVVTGDPYKFEALRAAQRRLFEMGTFSVVSVEPDLSDPTRAEVPISIRVTESKFRTLRLGVGFDYDSYIPVLRATARIRHVNLFHELLRAELGAKVGFAFDLNTADFSGRIPTWGVDSTVEYPRLFHQRGSLELRGSIEQDIYGGLWAYQRPEADLHLVYRFSEDVQFRVGPHVEQYTFIGEFGPAVQEAQQRLFGIESDAAFVYQLTSLDQFATWDWRDDPLHPTRGQYYSLTLREAVPLSQYGYGFVRTAGNASWYVPVRLAARGAAYPLTWILRSGGTAIFPYTVAKTVPLPERAFLGGSNSIRGFRSNQVGPYTALCTYQTVTRGGFLGIDALAPDGEPTTEEEVTRYYLPSGANYAVNAGTEMRYDWAYGVSFAAFLDGGALLDTITPGSLTDNALRGSVGVGARYDTKVGPLRFDVSFRPLYEEDRGPLRYSQCDPVDEVPRVVDLLSNFTAWRSYSDDGSGERTRPPIAIVFFLTFGEAI